MKREKIRLNPVAMLQNTDTILESNLTSECWQSHPTKTPTFSRLFTSGKYVVRLTYVVLDNALLSQVRGTRNKYHIQVRFHRECHDDQ